VPAVTPASTPAAELTPATSAPTTGDISYAEWLRNARVGQHRKLLVNGGRYLIEQLDGPTLRFTLWRLTTKHREAQSELCSADTIQTLLSFLMPARSRPRARSIVPEPV
jgi:hypothetical protein